MSLIAIPTVTGPVECVIKYGELTKEVKLENNRFGDDMNRIMIRLVDSMWTMNVCISTSQHTKLEQKYG